MQLSKRLQAVADMVTPGLVPADIGTDHAYIPIYLVETEKSPRAIAADVNRGPLLRADRHIQEHGLGDRIETRLSDGLSAIRPGEAQSLILAGMGGALVVRILQNGAHCLQTIPDEGGRSCRKKNADLDGFQELILQPQSEVPQVRAYLERSGWSIARENMIFEDGKYYPMMKAVRLSGFAGTMDELSIAFGPKLLESRHPVLQQFLLRERGTQEHILESLREVASGCSVPQNENNVGQKRVEKRRLEIQAYIDQIDAALQLYPVSSPTGA